MYIIMIIIIDNAYIPQYILKVLSVVSVNHLDCHLSSLR